MNVLQTVQVLVMSGIGAAALVAMMRHSNVRAMVAGLLCVAVWGYVAVEVMAVLTYGTGMSVTPHSRRYFELAAWGAVLLMMIRTATGPRR